MLLSSPTRERVTALQRKVLEVKGENPIKLVIKSYQTSDKQDCQVENKTKGIFKDPNSIYMYVSVREGSIWNGRSISISRARTKREVEF